MEIAIIGFFVAWFVMGISIVLFNRGWDKVPLVLFVLSFVIAIITGVVAGLSQ